RHLAHCQPCRRYALRAGVDLDEIRRPAAAAAARIAGLLPLPAFLRRRWSEESGPLLGNPGGLPVTQWSANMATVVEPGLMTSWVKAIATAATVAVAGLGAGSAFDERATGARPGVRGGPPAHVPGLDILATGGARAREAGATGVPAGGGPAAQRGGAATAAPSSGGHGSAPASEPGGTSPGRSAGRELDSSSSPAATNGGARAGGGGSTTDASSDAVRRVVETVGAGGGAPRADAGQTAGAEVPAEVPEDVPADVTPSSTAVASTGSDAVSATAETTAGVDPGATAAGGSVSSTTSDAASTTTATLSGLGG
ncbi:MAG TPA: hypothetical protein VG474_13960, partial [Solirubrobacteraceae bacterium]|nr:hypothetical protein [Solirubrobacteraceae bacterium]